MTNKHAGNLKPYMAMEDMAMEDKAVIAPFDYVDEVTGNKISLSVSQYYSKITVNDREYFFTRETGKFDGAATGRATPGRRSRKQAGRL